MSWHVHSNRSRVFDSDAYGVDTDNPLSAHEKLDEALKPRDERAIQEAYNDWLDQTAHEYFRTNDWDEEYWDAWREIVRDLTY